MTKKKQRKNRSHPKGDHPSGEKKEIAISVKNVSKTFQIPHQKVDSMRSAFVNMFQKKTFEKFHALDDVSFEVEKGQFVGIIGHNGSGKSTLLKVLSRVYEADGGTVDINGQISPFLELGIGFNPELSGRDNIYLNATILGLSQQEVDDKFDKIVAFSEIGEFIDQQVKNYSSGMKGRLAFSVSIHANREILIMDEVLAVGDSRFQQKCMNVFKGYKKEGKTVILVTHSVATVREYCDKALLLHHGKMIKSGDVDDVCDEYIERNMTEDQRQAAIKKESLEKAEEERVKQFEKEKKKEDSKNLQQKEEKILEKKNKIVLQDGNQKITLSFIQNKKGCDYRTGDVYDANITINMRDKNVSMDDVVLDYNLYKCDNNLVSINRNDVITDSIKISFSIPENFSAGEYYFITCIFSIDNSRNQIERFEYKRQESFYIVSDNNNKGPIALNNLIVKNNV